MGVSFISILIYATQIYPDFFMNEMVIYVISLFLFFHV